MHCVCEQHNAFVLYNWVFSLSCRRAPQSPPPTGGRRLSRALTALLLEYWNAALSRGATDVWSELPVS